MAIVGSCHYNPANYRLKILILGHSNPSLSFSKRKFPFSSHFFVIPEFQNSISSCHTQITAFDHLLHSTTSRDFLAARDSYRLNRLSKLQDYSY